MPAVPPEFIEVNQRKVACRARKKCEQLFSSGIISGTLCVRRMLSMFGEGSRMAEQILDMHEPDRLVEVTAQSGKRVWRLSWRALEFFFQRIFGVEKN